MVGDGGRRHAELCGQLCVARPLLSLTEIVALERPEPHARPVRFARGTQRLHPEREETPLPLAIENGIGIDKSARELGLGRIEIERKRIDASSSLEPPSRLLLVRDEAIE